MTEWQSNKDLKDTGDKQNEEVNFPNGSVEDKVLGIVWNSNEDSFMFKVKSESTDCLILTKWTTRSILSQIARIYDPVGLAAAFLIRAKTGLQELWQEGYEWDQDLPAAVQQKWLNLFKEVKELNKVSFPRSLSPPEPADSQPTLCVLADASQDAFGACAYIRWEVQKNKFDIRFIAAKSGVAPPQAPHKPAAWAASGCIGIQITIYNQGRVSFPVQRNLYLHRQCHCVSMGSRQSQELQTICL